MDGHTFPRLKGNYFCILSSNNQTCLDSNNFHLQFRWDPITRTWSLVAPMSCVRSTAGVAVLNSRIYVCGGREEFSKRIIANVLKCFSHFTLGRDGSSCHRSVECYDPHTNKWTPRAPMQYRRSGVGVGVLNGFLYAVGGHDSPTSNPSVVRTETVERYDAATDTWTLVK